MAATQNDILALINEIQPAADYPAVKMNPLLTNILAAAYGPMYMGVVPPGNTNDETDGFRPGSVGYDSSTQRYYICQVATLNNAVWTLIPSDSNFQVAAYTQPGQSVICGPNVSVVKCTNDNVSANQACKILLPSNPYQGKTVIVYLYNSFIGFYIRNSAGVDVVGASGLIVPAGQQYTLTYTGTAWEIVGVSNINPAELSPISISDSDGVVTSNSDNLTFLGTAVTVDDDGVGGTNITINPLSGLDIKEGGTTKKVAAQFLNFNDNNFNVTDSGTGGANVDYVSSFELFRSSTSVGDIKSIRFGGPAFSQNIGTVTIASDVGQVYLDGFKSWYGDVNNVKPSPANGVAESYSTGSIGTYLNRVYVCTNNSDDGAVWNRISEDYGVEILTPSSNSTSILLVETASVCITDSPVSISNYIIQAGGGPYVGKVISIFFGRAVTGYFKFFNAGGVEKYSLSSVSQFTTLRFICTDVSSQGQWRRI